MNDQLEQDLAAAFGEHAGGAVDTDVLAVAATRRGRRLRARTYAVRCAAAAVTVAVVTAGAAVYRSPAPPAAPSASASASPADLDWTLYPPPGGWSVPLPVVAGGAADPSKVGTDPSLLHFTVDEFTVDAPYTTWRSAAGIETISFKRNGADYRVSLTKDAALLDDDLLERGPGESIHERWQAAPGVWAQVYSRGVSADDIARVRARVRLDTTLRCTTPIQLSALPAGARLLGCETTLAGVDLPGRLLFSMLWVGENTVDRAEIVMMGHHPSPSPGTLMISGRPARVFTDDRFRPSVEFPDFNGLRIVIAGTGTYRTATLVQLAEAVRVGQDPANPATWADRPAP